ncbi:MAG TPA: chromate efflux transporter [Vicinamibacterales bacterium]
MFAVSLTELARVFLLLGTTAFGGPAAHIAMMHDQVVRRRRWIGEQEFADLIAATNLIPGPNSTEMAVHVGRRVAGWRGLLVAGISFILPSALIVSAFAVLYAKYGQAPDARALLAGVAPVIIAIIVQASWSLARGSLKRPALWLVAIIAATLALAGVNELVILGGSAVVVMLAASGRRVTIWATALATAGASAQATAAGVAAATPITLGGLSLFFLKVGSILFGSGYVLIAFLRADLVDRWHWLTDQQLVDAVAIGQFTPGPLSTTATFIGYLLGGWPGAVLCTVAIFLPGFVLVALTQPLIPRLRNSRITAALLDGVVAASLGLMAAVAVELARVNLTGPVPVAIAIVSVVVLVRWRINSAWLVLAGAAVGWFL